MAALVAGIVSALVPVAPASALSAAVVTLGSTNVGAASSYSIAFTVGAAAGNAMAVGNTFVVTFPAGTTVSAATVLTAGNVSVNGTDTTVAQTVAGQAVTVTSPVIVAASGAVTILFKTAAAVVNPTTGSTALTLTVATLGNVTPEGATASGAYTVAGPGQAVVSPNTANTAAQWTIQAILGTATAAGDAISVTFPAGTTVPSTISGTLVTVATVTVSATGANTSVNGNTLTIVNPALVPAGTNLNIVVSQLAGVKTPVKASAGGFSTTNASVGGPYYVSLSTTASPTVVTATVGLVVTAQISLSTTAQTQSAVVVITGVGFSANSNISVSGGPASGSSTTDATGSFTINAIRTGSSPAGAAVSVRDGTGNVQSSAPALLTLLPNMTVQGSPASVIAGQTIQLNGRNFGNLSSIGALGNITFGGAALVAANFISVNGGAIATAFVDLSFDDGATPSDDFTLLIRIPSDPTILGGGRLFGTQVIQVTDAAANVGQATVVVTRPSLTATPNRGPVGTIVTVTGAGYPAGNTPAAAANNNVKVIVSANVGTIIAQGYSTDSNGNFTATFTAGKDVAGANWPSVAAGTYTIFSQVLGVDAVNTEGANAFTLTAPAGTLSISPTSGPRGTVVSVSGSGFDTVTPATGITVGNLLIGAVAWNTAAQLPTGSPTTLGVAGQIQVTGGNLAGTNLTVPNNAAVGANTITATDNSAALTQGFSSFTVTQPTVTLSSATGNVGSTFTITGAGWLGNTPVTITVSNAAGILTTQSPISGSNGSITASFTVPSAAFNAG
ncbi:MAG: hypothetical protein HY261_05425, partial [Chloroflexi bacterium]|nr:hypothetical protein [Chloroflexota bacterium]